MNSTRIEYRGKVIRISYRLRQAWEPCLVFIHGLGACQACYKPVWTFPGYESMTVLTFDLPGFGDSARPTDFSYSMEEQAEVTRLLLEEFELEKVYLAGHSMGGAIGLLLAVNNPGLVKSFICLEGNLVSADCTGSRVAAGYSRQAFLDEGFDSMQKRIATTTDPVYTDCFSRADPLAFHKSSVSLVEWSDSGKLLEMFLGLDLPRYYVYGQRNAGAPLLTELENIPRIEVPDAGHAMMTDNPGSFYGQLHKILV